MPDPTEYYVDPLNGYDGNDGVTVATAWQTMQAAIRTIIQDIYNGDRINLRNTADDVQTLELNIISHYGTPTPDYPLIIQGFANTVGDGGIGGISGGGSVSIITDLSATNVVLKDLHLHNCGSNRIVGLGSASIIENCEFNNTFGDGFFGNNSSTVMNCYFHDIGGIGVQGRGYFFSNFFKNGSKRFNDAIFLSSTTFGGAFGNIISIDGTSNGIKTRGNHFIANNTIWSNAGTGKGIIDSQTGIGQVSIINNIIAGFSGAGGAAISIDQGGSDVTIIGGNAYYDNTEDLSASTNIIIDLGGNETVTTDPFVDAANDDFRITSDLIFRTIFSTFKGSSTDNYHDKGAVQRISGANMIGISDSAANKIADHVIRRKNVSVETSATADTLSLQSLYGVISMFTNKMEIVDNQIIVYDADGYELGRMNLTRDVNAKPITGTETVP